MGQSIKKPAEHITKAKKAKWVKWNKTLSAKVSITTAMDSFCINNCNK